MIKNLIFDMGNVLLGYRYHQMLLDFGLQEEKIEPIADLIFSDDSWNKFDAGLLSVEDMHNIYKDKCPDDYHIIARFFDECEKMIVHRPAVWERVDELFEKGYYIYILSNYSKYMYHKHTSSIPFLDKVHGAVISYQVNVTKPHQDIYFHLINNYKLIPEECVFFDDRPENIATAIALGMEGRIVESEEQLLRLLSEF